MPNRLADIKGQRFGRWTVIERVGMDKCRAATWLCRCDCGTERIVRGYALRYGHTQSCGCLQSEQVTERNFKHNESRTRLYRVWEGIKRRCYEKQNNAYKNYGGRGISMCEEWHNDFMPFRKWAYENGYRPDAAKGECTLDRIDNNGNYEPSNCRWVNVKVQSNNRRNNHLLEYNGETHTISEWSDITGISYEVILSRLELGWDVSRIMTQPVRKRRWHKKPQELQAV